MDIIKEADFNNLLELSKLEAIAKEKEFMIKDICSLLSWVEALKEVDTKNVIPLTHLFQDSVVPHKDIPTISLPHKEVLANAPDKNLNYIVIPKVK
jgi:aspartyl/glutamyl-tRNA(Asn/Gln) amidotransferase C subunit